MNGDKIKIIEFLFDKDSFTLSLIINIWILLIAVLLFILLKWLIKYFKNRTSVDKDIIPVKLKYKIAGTEIEYQIIRNYQNIEISHKIYIELTTRKAAIEIEVDKDVIVEIYNSWYSLIQITHEELKTINGKLLKENQTSKELVRLLTDILNKGLRPHLTEYQARFRKWYSEQLESKDTRSPQEIQKDFVDYENLMKSIKNVNVMLIEYSKQLEKIIDGK